LQNHRDDAEGTTKLLLAARDGSLLEAVVMRYADRATVCVSTQVGCPLGCAFCSTGAMGFQRNLTPGEILDQVRVAQVLLRQESEDRRVTNVVYMGMGEPFLNLEALLTSVRLLIDGDGLNFARRAVSVSTVGIPEGIRALADHEPQVGLALSLHAPEDGLRNRLVPINKRFPISQIMTSVREHTARTHRKLMVEYVLLANVNDSLHHADSLAQLLRGMMVVVNLLPCNPGVGGFRPTSAAAAHSFKERLEKAGVRTTMRTARGRSITAGCGQLATSSGNQLTTSSAKIRKNG